MPGCASAAAEPVTACDSGASSGSRIRSPRIDWCTAAAPEVSVIDGRPVEDLADRQIVEMRAAVDFGRTKSQRLMLSGA